MTSNDAAVLSDPSSPKQFGNWTRGCGGIVALYSVSQMESLAAAYGSDEEDEAERHVPWVGPGLAPLSSTKITVNCAPSVPDKASDANEQQYSRGGTPNPC